MNLSEALKIIEKAPKNELLCKRVNGGGGCAFCPIQPFRRENNGGNFACHDTQNNFALLETIKIAVRKEKLEKLLK